MKKEAAVNCPVLPEVPEAKLVASEADASGSEADVVGSAADAAESAADAAESAAEAAASAADAAEAAADAAECAAEAAASAADAAESAADAAECAADAAESAADATGSAAEVAAPERIPIDSRVLKHGTKTMSVGLYWDVRKTFEELMTAVDINSPEDGATTQPCSFDSQWTEALLEAARAGADFSEWNEWGDTPVHYIVDYLLDNTKSIELFEEILEFFENRSEVVNCVNNESITPLYRAIKNNNLKAVEVLIRRGANIYKVDGEGWSALHLAIYDHPVILNYLLEKVFTNVSIRNLYNDRGHTPLHTAVCCGQLHSFQQIIDKYPILIIEKTTDDENCLHLAVKRERFEIAVEIFNRRESLKIEHDICTDSFPRDDDKSGKNPFRAALQGRNKELVELFLQNGAILTNKGDEGKTALEIIATKFSDASGLLKNVFDHFITTPYGANKIEYSPLTNGQDMSQIKVIEELILHGHKDLLLHPLIHSLVYIKWNHFLYLFYAMVALQAKFLILFTVLVAKVFYINDTDNTNSTSISTNSTNTNSTNTITNALNIYLNGWHFWLLVVSTYTTVSILIMQEVLLVNFKRLHYVYDPENWIRLGFLVLAFFLPVVLVCTGLGYWQRHATCAALLLGWLQAMFLFSRFRASGTYVIMYGRVAVTFLKSFASTIFLVIAFALCFMIQFHSEDPFDVPVTAFLKTLVMMYSELDYGTLWKDHKKDLHDTALLVRLLVGLFVVFIGTALVNFLVSVSVNDIDKLTARAEEGRLEKQVQLLAAIEAFLYDGPFANVCKKVLHGQRYYMQLTYPAAIVTKWEVLFGVVSVKNDEFIILNEQISKVRPNAQLHEDIVDVGKRKKLSEEPINSLDKPKSGEEKENKEWVLEVISTYDEQIKPLANELRQVSRAIEQLKSIIGGVNVKINQLILNKHCICVTTSYSLKQMTSDIKKIAREMEEMKIAREKGENEDRKKNEENEDRVKNEENGDRMKNRENGDPNKNGANE